MFPLNPWDGKKGKVYKYKSVVITERSDSFLNSSRLLNATKRLPVLFCLDVSASMAVKKHRGAAPPIAMLNDAVKQLLTQIQNQLPMVEVAFLTFSERDIDYIPFQSLADVIDLEFRVVTGQNATCLAHAIEISVAMIEQERADLERLMVENYTPFLIVVTDGDEGDRRQSDVVRAQNLLYAHCQSHTGERNLIVPFIIGVGEDVSIDKLEGYSRGFESGFIRLRNTAEIEAFKAVFKIVGDSIGNSVNLNNPETFLNSLGQQVRDGFERRKKMRGMWDRLVGGEIMDGEK